jgi:hypothetical protein
MEFRANLVRLFVRLLIPTLAKFTYFNKLGESPRHEIGSDAFPDGLLVAQSMPHIQSGSVAGGGRREGEVLSMQGSSVL